MSARASLVTALVVVLAFLAPASAPAQFYRPPASGAVEIEPSEMPPDVAPMSQDARERLMGLWIRARDAATDEEAQRLVDEAIALHERTWGPTHPMTGQGLAEASSIMLRRGRLAEAERYALRDREIDLSRLGADHISAILSTSNLAEIYFYQYRFAEAEALQRDVLERAERRDGDMSRRLIRYVEALAQTLDAQGFYAQGEPLWRRALFLRDTGMTLHLHDTYGGVSSRADALAALAINLDYQGRSDEAERNFRFALTVREQEGWEPAIASALTALGVSLAYQGRNEEAVALYRRGLALHQTMGRPDPAGRAALLNNLGNSLVDLGRLDEAELALREALAIRVTEYGEDDPWTARTNSNLASLLIARGREAEAEVILERVLAVRRARLGDDHPDTASAQWSLAHLLIQRGRHAEAERLLQRALQSTQARLGPHHSRTSGLRIALALLYLQSGRATDAVGLASSAREGFASHREGLRRPAQNYEQNVAQTVADAALVETRANWEAGPRRALHREQGFLASQQAGLDSTSRAFASSMARAFVTDSGFGAELNAWRDAREQLAAIDIQIATAEDPNGRPFNRQRDAQQELEARTRALAAVAPRFFDLISPQPLSSIDTRALLGADEALIQFTPGHGDMPEGFRRGFVFALTREGMAWAEIPLEPDELIAEIAALHSQLEGGGATRSGPGTGNSSATLDGARAYDRARAYRLYRALFGDRRIARLISGKQRWTIAPQGALVSTPFAALVTERPDGGARGDFEPRALRETHWLGLERTLSITPAISALRMQRETPPAASPEFGGFFGVGDPAFDGEPGPAREALEMRAFFQDRSANVSAIRALRRLPGTRAEIVQLATAFGATSDDYILDIAATETELRRRNDQIGRAEVIAFATHGLTAGDLAGSLAEPALALTPPADATELDDGLLTASEAALLRLRARWVILSACNTAAGGRPDAEGLTGLARAFFYAGARTLLVSQWPVNDEAAQRLTTRAVEIQRRENVSTAEAMRRSMLELRDNADRDPRGRSFAHPSAWAPFILVSGE